MTDFSTSDIKHLATLSGLSLTDDEIQSLGGDLKNIIGYIDKLNELDVSGVEPTYQTTGLVNVSQEDEVDQGDVSRQQLLDLAPDQAAGQIKVPKVL